MKNILLLILSLLSLQTLAASPVWRVQSATSQLFLAGTVHILRATDYPLPPAFERAYAQAQELVFEVDIGRSNSPQAMQMLASAMLLPAGTRIESLLQPETLERLARYLEDNGLTLQRFAGIKPAMIATTLTMLELQKLGVGSKGVDAYYHQKARRDDKPVMALESYEQQVSYLAAMGRGMEDELIRQSLDQVESLDTDFNTMLSAWRNGDIGLLEELFITPMQRDFAPLYRELLARRNHDWLPRIIDYLQTPQTEMVLVGSAHLAGRDGLLTLLHRRGYTITQLD